jgi:plasmid stabilization system protein ParE
LELAVIWNYIKRDSEGNALQVLRDIGSAARRLKEHPLSGRMVPEWKRPDVRELIVGSYRMMYSLNNEDIIIFSVRHSRRRLPKRFRREWLG